MMSFDSQMLIVLLLIAVAALYIVRSTWRTARGKSQGCCKKGCGSETPSAHTNGHIVSSDELIQSLQRKPPRA
ncbi:MAG: FeoB-associated Cys-rich membrane protein [Gemmataceae bacterium]